MAHGLVIPTMLPAERELVAFTRAVAHLLAERRWNAAGARAVTRRAGVGIQHLDHRDYSAGDDVRHIDWRQTARRRRPIVRRFESETVGEWTILVDASSSMMVGSGAKSHRALQAAAAMSYALLELGHQVALLAFGAHVLARCPRGRGQRHYAMIARVLAGLRPAPTGERSNPGACVAHLDGATSVFTISDFLADDEMRRDLQALRQRCTALHALQVSDPADTTPAGAGEVDLVDIETGARMAVSLTAQARAAALAQRAAMTTRLRAFCARSAIAFTDWDVDAPWQQVLVRHLAEAQAGC